MTLLDVNKKVDVQSLSLCETITGVIRKTTVKQSDDAPVPMHRVPMQSGENFIKYSDLCTLDVT